MIKWPSNVRIATVAEFIFYSCSSHSSCLSCQRQRGCQWCSERCSSICLEPLTTCQSFDLLHPFNRLIESDCSAEIPLQLDQAMKSSLDCRLNETLIGSIDEHNRCHITRTPSLSLESNQSIYLSVYSNDRPLGRSIRMFLSRCDLLSTCEQCQKQMQCSWCQDQCFSRSEKRCSNNELCSSLRIKNVFPKRLPLGGETIVTIEFNELISHEVDHVTVANLPCSIIEVSARVTCRSNRSATSRQGPVEIRFRNSMTLRSKDSIEYRTSSIHSVNPKIAFEFGGQILHLSGKNLLIGNEQEIFVGHVLCATIPSTMANVLSCQLPALSSGIYNITLRLDKQTMIRSNDLFQVTPNPIVQDIYPTISFARFVLTIEKRRSDRVCLFQWRPTDQRSRHAFRVFSVDSRRVLLSTVDGKITSLSSSHSRIRILFVLVTI